jgi:hypothetical protein
MALRESTPISTRHSSHSGLPLDEPAEEATEPDTADHGHDPPEGDLHSFADRLSSIVTRMRQETEDGMNIEYVRPGSALGLRTSSPESTSPTDANESPGPLPPEYHSVARLPPEFPVRILGSYIRRMPTIESIGSRELHSAGSSSGHRTGRVASPSVHSHGTNSNSRPSTTRSQHSDPPPSRSNSGHRAPGNGRMGSEEGPPVENSQCPTTATYTATTTTSPRSSSQLERMDSHETDSTS